MEADRPVVIAPSGTTLLDRFTVRPHHQDAFRPLWHELVDVRARHGFVTHRGFLETRAEPRLTWLYSHPDPVAGDIELVQDPSWQRVCAQVRPHTFANRTCRPVRVELLTQATPASVAGRIAIMRRYWIVGDWGDFLAIWRRIVPVREKYDFRCLFAVSDEPGDLFTWSFDFAGDFDDFPAAQRDYYHDPDRVELRRVFDHMADYTIAPAGQLLPSGDGGKR